MKYTKEQLNARMAEVMGECVHEWSWRKYLYRCSKCGKTGTSRNTKPPSAKPYTASANQALMVLKKWCPNNTHRSWNIEHIEYVVCVTLYQDKEDGIGIFVVVEIEHESLPVAICLAIASAEDGEYATLEGV